MSTARQALIRVIRTAMQGLIAWGLEQAVPVFGWLKEAGVPVDEGEVKVALNLLGFALVVWLVGELEKWVPALSRILSWNLSDGGPSYQAPRGRHIA